MNRVCEQSQENLLALNTKPQKKISLQHSIRTDTIKYVRSWQKRHQSDINRRRWKFFGVLFLKERIHTNSTVCYHYQYIAILNWHIISQKRYKNTYAPKKYEKPAVRANFLQYVATVTTLCYYLKNKKRWELLKTICITGFFEQNFGPHCWLLLPDGPTLLN